MTRLSGWRRWALLGFGLLLMIAVLIRPGDPRYRFWRLTAGLAPADLGCGSTAGAHAALLRGRLGIADGTRCAAALLGPHGRWHDLLERLAADQTALATQRLPAALALFEGDRLEPRLARGLIAGPATPPALRRAVVIALGLRPGGSDIAAIGREEAVHDTWRIGALGLDGAGEAGFGRAAVRALDARPDEDVAPWLVSLLGLGESAEALRAAHAAVGRGRQAGRYEPVSEVLASAAWGMDGREVVYALTRWRAERAGEADGADQAPLGDGDGVLALLADGPTGDALREQLHAVARWIVRGPPAGRPNRLIAAVAHPEAVPAEGPEAWRGEAGLGPALADGSAGPAVVVFLATVLGEEAGVPVAVRRAGPGVRLDVAGTGVRLDGCGRRVADEGPVTEVSREGWTAMLLRAEAGRWLRAGSWARALPLLEAAEGAWSEGPDAEAGRLLIGGAARRPEAPVGALSRRAPLTAVLPPATRRGSSHTIGTGPPGGPLTAVGGSPPARVTAAWWLARMGRGDRARALLIEPVPSDLADFAAGVLLLLGEPARAVGPVSAWVAGDGPPPWSGCPATTPLAPALVGAGD